MASCLHTAYTLTHIVSLNFKLVYFALCYECPSGCSHCTPLVVGTKRLKLLVVHVIECQQVLVTARASLGLDGYVKLQHTARSLQLMRAVRVVSRHCPICSVCGTAIIKAVAKRDKIVEQQMGPLPSTIHGHGTSQCICVLGLPGRTHSSQKTNEC